MKVILYMAITPNGMVAKSDDDTSWVSNTEWNSYSETVRTARNMVVGHRTYDIITKQPEFLEFENVNVIIVSKEPFQTLSPNHTVVGSPQEALERLKDFENVIVAGGGKLNGSFITEGLVDEIFLDVEPSLFGNGIKLFGDADFEVKLKLLGTRQLSPNEVQLHYKVVK